MELDMELSSRQMEIIDACTLGNGIEHVLACTGRQVGKTTTAMIVGTDWCLSHSNLRVGFVMPTYRYCRKVWQDMKSALAPLIKCNAVTFLGSPLTITFANGSEIRFYTAENESARGESFDCLIIDEACMISNYIYNAVIEPTMNDAFNELNEDGNSMAKILTVSTPKSRNFFFDLLSDSDPTYYKVRFTTQEGGRCPQKIIDKAKLKLAPDHFRNEYMGEFSDGNGTVFNFSECVAKEDHKTVDNVGIVAALDIGGKVDSTVLTIQNKAGEVILQKGWVRDWPELINPIMHYLNAHGSPICHVETNGVGETPFVELRNKYGKVKPWRTTSTTKPTIIEKLIYDFNTKNILVPRIDELLDELTVFETKESTNGARKYGAPSGKHDDRIMSLAICNYNRSRKTAGLSLGTVRRKASNDF